MKQWLSNLFESGELYPDAEEYLLSRGGKRERIESLNIISWDSVKEKISPDPIFNERYNSKDYPNRLKECFCTPYYSITGEIIGFEARKFKYKWVTDFRLSPHINFCTYWLGADLRSMEKLWAGGKIWIVEGLFDLFALDWVIPESDVVVAAVQSKLTDSHLEFLRRFASFVNLAFDMDAPGRRGVYKAAPLLRKLGVPNRVIDYGPGKDPGEIWDRGGVRELKEVFLQQWER